MSRTNFLSLLFLAIFSFLGFNSAQAQIFCNGSNSCPAGYAQIEVTNNTGCDYEITMYHEVNGVPTTTGCTVNASSTLVICYDYTTTKIQVTEVVETLSGNSAKLKNPGYPGSASSGVTNGGCGGSDTFTWQNSSSTGPGHVTNFIIQ